MKSSLSKNSVKSENKEILAKHSPDPSKAAPIDKMNPLHQNVKKSLESLPNFNFEFRKHQATQSGIELGPFKYTDGSTYVGEYRNGLKHGYGE